MARPADSPEDRVPPVGYGSAHDTWDRYRDTDRATDDSPAPTHACVSCDTETHIESEPRARTQHFCDSCDRVTRHKRLK